MGKVVANQWGAIWDGHGDFPAGVRDMVAGLQHECDICRTEMGLEVGSQSVSDAPHRMNESISLLWLVGRDEWTMGLLVCGVDARVGGVRSGGPGCGQLVRNDVERQRVECSIGGRQIAVWDGQRWKRGRALVWMVVRRGKDVDRRECYYAVWRAVTKTVVGVRWGMGGGDWVQVVAGRQ